MKTSVLAMLQNAWSPLYAGGHWPRESWLGALRRSRSGQRLRKLEAVCPDIAFIYDNTTPVVGEYPWSIVKPDMDHARLVLKTLAVDAVVALGIQAGDVLLELVQDKPLLLLPHPACRVVTNKLYEQAGQLLNTGFDGIIQLKQERGRVAVFQLRRKDDSERPRSNVADMTKASRLARSVPNTANARKGRRLVSASGRS